MQLFCFPFAGGTSSFFDQLDPYIQSDIELEKLEYSGHGKRFHEPFYQSFEELAEDLSDIIQSKLKEPFEYALFGYSMGSIACVEVLKKLISCPKLPLPKYIFLAAHGPCAKKELVGYTGKELDDIVKKITLDFGGIPEKLIDNALFWRTYLPVYKADYNLITNYGFIQPKPPFPLTVVIFYSEQDIPRNEIELWQSWFTSKIEYYKFEGNHFFISDYCDKISRIINNKLKTN